MLQIARVLKSNGTDGGLLLAFRGTNPEDIDIKEPVYLRFDEIPVPFFILDIKKKGNDKAIVHLNDINTLEDAEEVVGKEVFADIEEGEDEMDELGQLTGWTLSGAGTITSLMDIPGNPCLEVQTKKGAVLIPLHEDLIKSVNSGTKTIEMDIPKGILDI